LSVGSEEDEVMTSECSTGKKLCTLAEFYIAGLMLQNGEI
jgi:hypothetical protein